MQFGSVSTAAFYVFTRFQFFFFFLLQPHLLTKSTMNSAPMHGSWVPQITLFSNFFIKNGSHDIIYTFKNYFVTMFLIFNFIKIRSIQTDPTWLLLKERRLHHTHSLLLVSRFVLKYVTSHFCNCMINYKSPPEEVFYNLSCNCRSEKSHTF